jgi:hypothetical protein
MAEAIVGREGGFVNHPADPGGATNWGVTIHTLRRLNLDLDGDGDVDVDDVRALSRERAVQIFVDDYYYRPRLDHLPAGIQSQLFDMQVNAGANAVKLLQRVLNASGALAERLVEDGAIGQKTAAAAFRVWMIEGDRLNVAYALARRDWYMRLAEGRPSLRAFAQRKDGGKGGWIVRAEEWLPEDLHWTDAEWRDRVARWSDARTFDSDVWADAPAQQPIPVTDAEPAPVQAPPGGLAGLLAAILALLARIFGGSKA